MKNILKNSLWLCLLCPILVGAQTKDENSLRQDLAAYFETVQKKQVDKTLDYIYPKVFEILPKEELVKTMEEMYGDPEVQVNMDRMRISNIAEIMTHESSNYTQVDYSFVTLMSFPGMEVEEEEEEETSENVEEEEDYELDFGAFMLEMFKAQYGEENVKWDAENNTMEVNFERTLFAIWDPVFPDSWKFIDKRKNLMSKIKQIVPKAVWKKWKK